MTFELEQRNLDRAAGMRTADRPRPYIRQRIADAGAQLDRAGRLQSQLDLCIEAVAALLSVAYNVDSDGRPANVDPVTGQLLIPVPWSDGGCRRWGLRQWEARRLRTILRDRARRPRRLPPLFDYSEINNRWYIDLTTYPTPAAALAWLRRDGPSLAEWRSVMDEARERHPVRGTVREPVKQ